MADDVLLSDAEVAETAETRKKAKKPRTYKPRLRANRDPAVVDTSAPLVSPAPKAAVEEIKPGAVGAAQASANDIVARDVRGPFWWLLRQR